MYCLHDDGGMPCERSSCLRVLQIDVQIFSLAIARHYKGGS